MENMYQSGNETWTSYEVYCEHKVNGIAYKYSIIYEICIILHNTLSAISMKYIYQVSGNFGKKLRDL